MPVTHWTIRVTLESSAKQQVEEMARSERRSVANYFRVLVEDKLKEQS